MATNQTRRKFLMSTAGVGTVAIAGCTDAEEEEPAEEEEIEEDEEEVEQTYEVWAADQGLNVIHIYEPAGGGEFEEIDTIDTNADDIGGEVPHMIDFSSDYEYAAVACTAGGRVLVYRTEDRELVGNIETGAGSHFASFSPDDDYLTVDIIGENRIAKVEIDWEDESFEETDEEIVIAEDTELGEDNDPICHQFDGNGRSIHTLGPSYHDAGVVVVDHEDFSVAQEFSDEELPANCGTVPHPTEDKFYLTAGLPTPTDDDGEPIDGEEGVGDYYVLDTSGDEIEVIDDGSTEGIDAHGFWFTPDAEELWVLNRETNDGIILDPETDEQIDEIDAYGPETAEDTDDRDAPDIMWASPDGEYMFVTLRGPNPQSGDPHAATGVNPGFAVFDIESRERVDTIIPSEDDDESDFHGIGVRPIGEHDGFTSPHY